MKAILKVNATRMTDGEKEIREYEVNISKDKNKLILEYPNQKYFPWDTLSACEFQVNIKPTEDEIYCGDCDTCLTPIC
jgi:hypothetical protein